MMYSTKTALVIRADLSPWQVANVAAFLSGGLAGGYPEIVGEPYRDGDGRLYTPMIREPISQAPESCSLRACTCSFCRSHRPRMISDRNGNFEVWADDWQLVEHYRFGTGTCDFLICRRCGIFIAAIAKTPAGTQAVVNVNCLEDSERFTSDPVLHDFEGETLEIRSLRRAANWMPAFIH